MGGGGMEIRQRDGKWKWKWKGIEKREEKGDDGGQRGEERETRGWGKGFWEIDVGLNGMGWVKLWVQRSEEDEKVNLTSEGRGEKARR
jgi:hypothetical protein